MALVCFLIWSYGLLGLQLSLPPSCLSFSTFQLLLLATRLCWHFAHDNLLLLCSNLLCLHLPSLFKVILSYLHFCTWFACHHHPPCTCFLCTSLPNLQGYPIPFHGFLGGNSSSPCCFYLLGPSTDLCGTWI